MNYTQAEKLFNTARDKTKGKPLGANRRLYKRDDGYAIRYHQTDIVTIHKDGTYTIDNGGYRTVTTKKWINTYAPVRISQKDYVWYIDTALGRVAFDSGMKVDKYGDAI